MATQRKYAKVKGYKLPRESDVEMVNTKQIFDGHNLSEKDIKFILAENDFMKQELYQRQSDEVNRVYQIFHQYVNTNTSRINKQIQNSARTYNIPPTVLYKAYYNIFETSLMMMIPKINGKSKIFTIWRMGLLPIFYVISYTINYMFSFLMKHSPTHMRGIFNDLEKFYAPKKPKP